MHHNTIVFSCFYYIEILPPAIWRPLLTYIYKKKLTAILKRPTDRLLQFFFSPLFSYSRINKGTKQHNIITNWFFSLNKFTNICFCTTGFVHFINTKQCQVFFNWINNIKLTNPNFFSNKIVWKQFISLFHVNWIMLFQC
jgi:hypothetical protein